MQKEKGVMHTDLVGQVAQVVCFTVSKRSELPLPIHMIHYVTNMTHY